MPPGPTGAAIFLVYLHDKMEAALPHQLYYIPAQRNVRGYPIPRGVYECSALQHSDKGRLNAQVYEHTKNGTKII